ncbi:unnamed protein product [Auanema sp. JU1783]|nr:unnamed protein product [Auanema sp. JU1783]
MHVFYSVALLLSILCGAFASVGDFSPHYRQCIHDCRVNLECPSEFIDVAWSFSKCFKCRYNCMWNTVDHFVEQKWDVPQFHGKWPFIAIEFFGFGPTIQEPCSTIFSLLNLCSYVYLYNFLKKSRFVEYRHIWIGYTIVGVLAWSCSALFHARDNWITEYMDYFAACALVLYGFYASLHITVFSSFYFRGSKSSLLTGFILLLFYVQHIRSMLKHFDYGYNMLCCIVLSIATSVLYLFHLLRRRHTRKIVSESDFILWKILFYSIFCVLLEVFDFAPILWFVDAHSLFHLSTIPIPLWFSKFLYVYNQEYLADQLNKKI